MFALVVPGPTLKGNSSPWTPRAARAPMRLPRTCVPTASRSSPLPTAQRLRTGVTWCSAAFWAFSIGPRQALAPPCARCPTFPLRCACLPATRLRLPGQPVRAWAFLPIALSPAACSMPWRSPRRLFAWGVLVCLPSSRPRKRLMLSVSFDSLAIRSAISAMV